MGKRGGARWGKKRGGLLIGKGGDTRKYRQRGRNQNSFKVVGDEKGMREATVRKDD